MPETWWDRPLLQRARTTLRWPALPFALALCLVGVSVLAHHDPQAPSKQGFEKALKAYYASRDCAVLPIPTSGVFPVTITTMPGMNTGQIDALVEAGLLQRQNQRPAKLAFNAQAKLVDIALTGRGHALLRTANSEGLGSPAGFCAGRFSLASVDGWAPPVDTPDGKIDRVTFTTRIEIEDWVHSEAVQKAFQGRIPAEGDRQSALWMSLSPSGWAVDVVAGAGR